MIECKDVEYILAIARNRSISNAACELYISQPALTKYLHGLERRFGVELFNRTGKRMIPTAAGERYIEYASRIAECHQELELEMQRIKALQKHTIKVAFSTNCARKTVLEAEKILHHEYPNLQIEVSECISGDIEKKLLSYELDLGFLTLPCAEPDLETEVIAEEYILLGMPRNHPLVKEGVDIPEYPYPWIDIGLCSGEAFVVQNDGTRFRMQTDKIFKKYEVKPDIILTARNRLTTIEFAESREAMFLASEAFQEYIRDRDQMSLFVLGMPVEKTYVGAAYRRGGKLSTATEKMLKIVRELNQ